MKTILLFAMFSLSLSAGAATSRVGNGGDGVRTENGLVLLDFLEAGVELSPYLNPAVVAADATKVRLTNALPFADAETITLIAAKLKEIELADATSSWTLLKAIELFSWGAVSPALVDIPDEDTNLDIPSDKLVQLAIRSGRRIQINRNLWQELNPFQRAGLIFHETVYALAPVESLSGRNGQNSSWVRSLVGYLFSERLTSAGRDGFLEQARGMIPSVPSQAWSYKISSKGISYKYGWNVSYEVSGGYSHDSKLILEFPAEQRFAEVAKNTCFNEISPYEFSGTTVTVSSTFNYSVGTSTLDFDSFDDGSRSKREYLKLALSGQEHKIKLDSQFVFKNKEDCVRRFNDYLSTNWKKESLSGGYKIYQ